MPYRWEETKWLDRMDGAVRIIIYNRVGPHVAGETYELEDLLGE